MSGSVFIVRPFGNNRPVIKTDKNGTPSIDYLDFDTVEKQLIEPAMAAAGLEGGTTQRVFLPGEIKEDMFSDLLLADIVIADITIHNANVFYELGIRHALRDKITILIKCSGYDDTPFDIIGYKYISYKKDAAADALNTLIHTITEALAANRKDSPVFNILPYLQLQDTEKYIAVPEDFIEEVAFAKASGYVGKLALLAYEAESFRWKLPAFRLVGEALFKLEKYSLAKEVWQKVVKQKKEDLQANDRLSTIYQRLASTEMKSDYAEARGLLSQSDKAARIIIDNKTVNRSQHAEAFALLGRNDKTRWIQLWSLQEGDERCKTALTSQLLQDSFENYERGFKLDLNHYYSGLNALALLSIIVSLAEQYPDCWELKFDSPEDAVRELQQLKKKKDNLSATLSYSIEASRAQSKTLEEKDKWLTATEAEYLCLTSKNPAKVEAAYKRVMENTDPITADSSRNQLSIYESLGVLPENTKAAVKAISGGERKQNESVYFLLFTGHMIDAPQREKPRFPPEKEKMVREQIKAAVEKVMEKLPVM